MSVDIHKLLDGKWEDGTRPKDLYSEHVGKQPSAYIDAIISGLRSGNRRIENGCAELASLLSEEHPKLLYPHVQLFIANLKSREKVVRWEAVCTLGNLASIDAAMAIVPHIGTMTAFLRDKSIVLQGHAVRALAKIATAVPKEAKRVSDALIAAKDSFPGNRIGFVIEAMESFAGLSELAGRLSNFVAPYAESDINVVARKAKKVLKALDGSGTKKNRT
jgi:hypothetical protein